MTSPTAGLYAHGLTVYRGGIQVLDHVELRLSPGQLCAVIGPSGAGKSTLIKVLLGLMSPGRGEVRLHGEAVGARGPVGYVPQDDALHTGLTVRQTLYYAAELRLGDLSPDERADRIETVCGQLDLAERLDVRVGRLSGGQRKRVAVAVELLSQPGLLVLDEPTSGLDPGLEARSMQLFATLAADGRIVIVTTHAMQSLQTVDVLLVIAAGKVVYQGPPDPAPAYFGATTFAGIFPKLAEAAPARWRQRWLAHRSGRAP